VTVNHGVGGSSPPEDVYFPINLYIIFSRLYCKKRKKMKSSNLWLIWIPLIVLVIMLFPKSCGFQNLSTELNYKCSGFKTPFLSQMEKSDNPQQWCSGICISKTIVKNTTQSNQTIESDIPSPFSGMTDSFGKVIPGLFAILLVIGLINWIGSIKKK
jgi:hypothetical protein